MTTPSVTPFPATTPRAGVFAPFVIVSDFDDEITTLHVRPAPPSPDHTPTWSGYPLNSNDDSSNEDLSEIAKSLHTQTDPTSVFHPPPTQPLHTSLAFSRRSGKEISMPLGHRAAMDRWIAKGSITRSQLRAEYVEQEVRELREFWVTDKFEIAKLRSRVRDIEANFWDLERHLGP
uniref:Uncharacterized protein n=1 Tax=Tanacetum cinerariifolium TaxID=118510 RepID=A0A6L2N5S1_TANCI|nr:hypothetical protein [Tanacetum cinerariifolium]